DGAPCRLAHGAVDGNARAELLAERLVVTALERLGGGDRLLPAIVIDTARIASPPQLACDPGEDLLVVGDLVLLRGDPDPGRAVAGGHGVHDLRALVGARQIVVGPAARVRVPCEQQ